MYILSWSPSSVLSCLRSVIRECPDITGCWRTWTDSCDSNRYRQIYTSTPDICCFQNSLSAFKSGICNSSGLKHMKSVAPFGWNSSTIYDNNTAENRYKHVRLFVNPPVILWFSWAGRNLILTSLTQICNKHYAVNTPDSLLDILWQPAQSSRCGSDGSDGNVKQIVKNIHQCVLELRVTSSDRLFCSTNFQLIFFWSNFRLWISTQTNCKQSAEADYNPGLHLTATNSTGTKPEWFINWFSDGDVGAELNDGSRIESHISRRSLEAGDGQNSRWRWRLSGTN